MSCINTVIIILTKVRKTRNKTLSRNTLLSQSALFILLLLFWVTSTKLCAQIKLGWNSTLLYYNKYDILIITLPIHD